MRGAPGSGAHATAASFSCSVSFSPADFFSEPDFGGQITPSHERSRHLKSGARGFRLVRRLSHILPPHFGHVSSSRARTVSDFCSALASVLDSVLDSLLPSFRAYTIAGSSTGFA